DHDCWPKNATLKSTIARSTGTWVTNTMIGMSAALAPSAILRALLSECPDARCRVRDPGIVADLLHVEAAHVVEVLRQPEQVEVPGRVAQELGDDEPPDLHAREEIEPRDAVRAARGGRGQHLRKVRSLRLREPG